MRSVHLRACRTIDMTRNAFKYFAKILKKKNKKSNKKMSAYHHQEEKCLDNIGCDIFTM